MKRKLKELCEKQQWKCYYCGETMKDLVIQAKPKACSKRQHRRRKNLLLPSVEHLYARYDVRRFIGTPEVAAHIACNCKKSENDHINMVKEFPREKEFKGLIKNLVKGTVSL